VFDAWTTGSKVRQWFGLGLGEVTRALIDPRKGGIFSFVQRRGLDDVEHNGKYQEFVPPNRWVFSWQVKGTNGASRVLIDIALRDNGCELTLVHKLDPHWVAYTKKWKHHGPKCWMR
jgi:uncharacterized protein YndB with AHSA1/START domain